MTKNNNITIVPSDLESKFAPKIDQNIILSLDQKQQELVETDRSSNINLLQVYDDERQRSTTFRPTFKMSFIFKNLYYGTTGYDPFENQLYYLDPENTQRNCLTLWEGYPQYKEFDLIREDINISGYTTNSGTTDAHVNFQTVSASSYNWSLYMSYPYKNNENLRMEYWERLGFTYQLQNQWIASDGIPFIIKNREFNGSNVISFICPMDHGLSVGESVKLSFSYNGNDVFLVDSLGDETYGSEFYIFNIDDIGYTGTIFQDDAKGTFKRVINSLNPTDTTSKYYVREHKILTDDSEKILLKSGFELNSLNKDKKIEFSALTPDKNQRVSVKEGNQSYTVTFKKDVDINGLLDNQSRPLTELYLTIINRGYFGWFNKPLQNNNALKFGFEFNIKETTNPWWDKGKTISTEPNIQTDSYQKQSQTFYYNAPLKKGDTLYGDFCEWNDYEQTERVISNINHKITFNDDIFSITNPNPRNRNFYRNPYGYYYQVHHPIKIKDYSSYIETLQTETPTDIPDYSYFSDNEQTFRWRDIYTYGFIDEAGNGVDYPFINGVHYPSQNIIFKLKPEGYEDYLRKLKLIVQPNSDDCATV